MHTEVSEYNGSDMIYPSSNAIIKLLKNFGLTSLLLISATMATAQRAIEWSGYGDDGYLGSGDIDYAKFFWGILLGITLQRLFEKKMDIDEGWFHTILMSFWVATPASIAFVVLVF